MPSCASGGCGNPFAFGRICRTSKALLRGFTLVYSLDFLTWGNNGAYFGRNVLRSALRLRRVTSGKSIERRYTTYGFLSGTLRGIRGDKLRD